MRLNYQLCSISLFIPLLETLAIEKSEKKLAFTKNTEL